MRRITSQHGFSGAFGGRKPAGQLPATAQPGELGRGSSVRSGAGQLSQLGRSAEGQRQRLQREIMTPPSGANNRQNFARARSRPAIAPGPAAERRGRCRCRHGWQGGRACRAVTSSRAGGRAASARTLAAGAWRRLQGKLSEGPRLARPGCR